MARTAEEEGLDASCTHVPRGQEVTGANKLFPEGR